MVYRFFVKVDAMSLEEIECMLKETKERKDQALAQGAFIQPKCAGLGRAPSPETISPPCPPPRQYIQPGQNKVRTCSRLSTLPLNSGILFKK